MNELKKELGLVQGVILLTTSLLGTGVFALPELAALAAGDISLWAWPLLIILIFPIAIVFAVLGRHFPHAGGVAHFVGMAFGPRLQRVISWLFLSVIPVSFPAALHIAVGFGQALFGWQSEQLLFGELGTLGLLWFMGSRGASSSANLQAIIAGLIIALIAAILWKGAIKPADITFPAANEITFSRLCTALAIMFWGFVGIEAFTHLSSEFKNPERDFPRALIIGLMLAGSIYWACTPHQLTRPGNCRQMAIFSLPMHLFLSWPLDRDLINHVTHGMVVKSLATQQLSTFEVLRWQQETSSPNEQIRQLAIDEIGLMLKRFSLSGWQPILLNKTSRTHKNSVSRHAQFYVSQMLGFIADNYDQALTINDVAEHVKLNANYAMGIFQRVMQLTMKQYITAMRINHVRALLSDTDKTILDVALTAGFRSSSRFYSTFSKFVGMSPQQYRKLSQQRRQTMPG
ncbi:hypothetical protein CC898_21900 [Salmonella enterica subsp. enterica serovar Agona]|nr:hypothetical protein [Salmonella enterica subsp. enterica serovar Agona]